MEKLQAVGLAKVSFPLTSSHPLSLWALSIWERRGGDLGREREEARLW